MIKPNLAWLSWAFVWVGILGCSPKALAPQNPGPGNDAQVSIVDGSTPPYDASACDCRIGADGVLRMSWACFNANYGNGSRASGWCGAPGQWTSACGLDVFTYDQVGQAQLFVYDQSGNQVGVQFSSASGPGYVCPTDPTLTAMKVAGGMFPASSCPVTACSCDHDASGAFTGTFTCPASDAGTADAGGSHDAAACGCTRDTNGAQHTSWACFCQTYGCPAATTGPLHCTSDYRWIYACGLWGATWAAAAAPRWTFYDATGAAVGIDWLTDETSGEFSCTSYGGRATELIAGQIPSSQCTSVPCSCAADGTVSCPGVDAGPP
jgi:hypothetical protein